MSNIDKRPFRADGGDISTGRLREIADNPYGDEEKCWLAKRVLALQDELEAAEKRIAELEAKLANPVVLPKTNGYWTEQEKAYEEAITLAKRQVRLAGFRCEGDE